MRGRATHKTDKVVVLLGGNDIRAKISYSFRVDFRGSIKAKADWDMFILEVTVDSLWAANDFALSAVLSEVLGKEACIRVRIIATNNYETIKVEILRILERVSELLRGLNLMTSGA